VSKAAEIQSLLSKCVQHVRSITIDPNFVAIPPQIEQHDPPQSARGRPQRSKFAAFCHPDSFTPMFHPESIGDGGCGRAVPRTNATLAAEWRCPALRSAEQLMRIEDLRVCHHEIACDVV
jgi:hypothetical protein